MKRTSVDYVRDILEALGKAQSFTEEMEYSTFAQDEKTIFAVARALEIVGEATKNVPGEVRNRFPDIPWRVMAGMRDVLIHGYFDVNLEVLWKTATERAPHVIPALQKALEVLETLDAEETNSKTS